MMTLTGLVVYFNRSCVSLITNTFQKHIIQGKWQLPLISIVFRSTLNSYQTHTAACDSNTEKLNYRLTTLAL